ncbi:MAG TPA: GAF domain-containing protein [Sphingomicrobium sp.]|nr:GAF domain-containing protein [Sphingomicrobium sp.]
MPAQDADIVQDARAPVAAAADSTGPQIQPAGFLIQLSLDWIVLRASENVDDFLGQSHVTLIDEPLGRFVQAQALHDLRNLFSRLSGSTGVARAYRVRLAHDRPRFDIAFQVSDGRVLLEGAPSPERGLGEAMGSVAGLVDGLSAHRGEALLEAAARRVRALTGCDRALILCRDDAGERSAHSSRGRFGDSSIVPDLPAIVADAAAAPVPLFPRKAGGASIAGALLRSPSAGTLQRLGEQEIASAISVPLSVEGRELGIIQCHSRSARAPRLELHAAAELFAQSFALRLEIDRLRG